MAVAMAPLSTPTLRLGAAILLLLSCCLPFPSALSSSSAPGVRKPYREFDYFSLCLQWPGTMCQRTRHCCSSNGCCDSSVPLSEFTIHGLWPDYNDGSWPACCSETPFDINKVSSLMGELKKYWPSLSCSSSSLCFGGKGLFWAHEWEKHGTCSFPVITDEYDYFSTVLDLYHKYNMTKILDDAGFVASNAEEYPLRDVVTAVENAVGTSPLLVCSHGSVEELRICFDKNLKPRDCLLTTHGTLHSSSSCPNYISLPNYTRIARGENSTITWLPDDKNSSDY